MSRVGKSPVVVPKDVQVQLTEGQITVKGKLGELKSRITKDVVVVVKGAEANDNGLASVCVDPANETKTSRAMWGTTRNIINNMVKGVSEGFVVRLEMTGVGYRSAVEGNIITLTLGYSHEIKYALPASVSAKCEKPTLIVLSGSDKQQVGQIAGEIMKFRPVEPYKGKGIYKEGSYIRRKEGKKK